MNYLDKILENKEIAENIQTEFYEMIKILDEDLALLNIQFNDENSEYIFENHLIALIVRIINKQFVDDIEESMFLEVSEKSFELSNKVVKKIFEYCNMAVNKSELFLVATHLELNIQEKEEK